MGEREPLRSRTLARLVRSRRRAYRRIVWWRRVSAVLVALMGLVTILSALAVHVRVREQLVHTLLPLAVMQATRHVALMAGFGLFAVSRGLWRGKRWTWGVTIGLLLGSAITHLTKGLDWEEASAALALVGLLWWQRAAFRARADAPTLRRAFAALIWSGIGFAAYVVVGSYLLRRQFAAPATVDQLVREVGARLALNVGPLIPRSRRANWFLESISAYGATILTYLVAAFLRPIVAPTAAEPERERTHALLKRYGRSSLSPFALLPDKSVYFGRSVEGVVAFRVAGGVAVVCGDPIVAPELLADLLAEFSAYCAEQGWEICVYEPQAAAIATYKALGLHALKIGEDAWINLRTWTLKGKAIADVRHAVAKIERDGVQFRLLDPDDPAYAAYWTQMQALAAAQDRGAFELQFSIGRLPATPDPEAHYTLALSADGQALLGFCAWLPIYGENGWALDVLQRAPEAPNGTIEYVIAQALFAFQAAGAAWASLGVAPLADASPNAEGQRNLLERGVRFLYEHPRVNELYHYKSLYFFKRKFAPVWRSVYLVYGSRLALPRIIYAILKVHLPSIGWSLLTDVARGEIARLLPWRQTGRSARTMGTIADTRPKA